MTDFLKQYRKTAGLVSKENNRQSITPTKESQMYLSQTSAKTPTRSQQTQQIAKKVAAQKQQINSSNPFGRVDTNRSSKAKLAVTPTRMTKNPSSRSALKGQMHADIDLHNHSPPQHKTQTEMKKANYSSTRPSHTSSVVAKQYQQSKLAAEYTNPVLKAAESSRHSNNATPIRQQRTRETTSYDLKATQSSTAKRASISYSKPNQQIPTPKPVKQQCSFAYATPSAARTREAARTPVPVADHSSFAQPTTHQAAAKPKKPANLTRKQREKLEEENELNALKNAKILTTKKLFFPESFKVKKQPSFESATTHKTPSRPAKVMSVNLDTDASEIMEPSEASTYGQYIPKSIQKRRSTMTTTPTPATYQQSSVDDYADTKSNKSGISAGNSTMMTNGGGRRSRKDRSGFRNQSKEARTTIKKLETQTSLLTQQPQPTHQVRLLPGSDTLSLEIQGVEGMSNPFAEGVPTPLLETVDSVNEQTVEQIQSAFTSALEQTIKQTNQIEQLQSKSIPDNRYQNSRNHLENPTFEYKGSLNAYVQQSNFQRARTPISLEEKYSNNTTSKLQSLRDNRYGKRNSVTPNYAESHSTPQQSCGDRERTYGRVKGFSTMGKSAPRSSMMGASRNHNPGHETADTSLFTTQSKGTMSAYRRKSVSTLQAKRPVSTPTVGVERASEKLEKINSAFRAISLSTFDIMLQIKKPTQMEFDAAQLLCLFVNAFRDISLAWPSTHFESWQTIVQFLVNSPNANKICLEIQNIKKKVLRPHLAHIESETYEELRQIRNDFLENRTERAIQCLYSGLRNKPLKSMVMVVLTSINHLLPKEEESMRITEAIEQHVEQPQQLIPENQSYVQISPEHVKNLDFDDIANVEVPTMEMQQVNTQHTPMQQNLFMHQEVSLSHVGGQYDTNQPEEQSIASSRGSAWPSQSNRLTPNQTEKKSKCVEVQTSIPQQKQRRSRQCREEPTTEIKRVPYKINLKAEGDMFGDISDSGMDDEQQDDSSSGCNDGDHLQLYNAEASFQSTSFNVEIQPVKTGDDMEVAGFTLSRATLRSDQPAEYSTIPEPIPTLDYDVEESIKGLHDSMQKLNKTAQYLTSSNMKLPTGDLYSQIISPMGSPEIGQGLHLRRESVGGESDSILNSCSPAVVRTRLDWNVMSPKKLFSPDKPSKQLSVCQEESSRAGPDIAVDDAEESELLQPQRIMPSESAEKKAEPDTSELTNEIGDEEEVGEEEMTVATEIKMCFSPSKLTKMAEYVNETNEHKKQSSAFELKQIAMQAQFKQETTVTYNAGFMEKMRQKRSESCESPRQKELRFKEMREKRLRDIEEKLARWD